MSRNFCKNRSYDFPGDHTPKMFCKISSSDAFVMLLFTARKVNVEWNQQNTNKIPLLVWVEKRQSPSLLMLLNVYRMYTKDINQLLTHNYWAILVVNSLVKQFQESFLLLSRNFADSLIIKVLATQLAHNYGLWVIFLNKLIIFQLSLLSFLHTKCNCLDSR